MIFLAELAFKSDRLLDKLLANELPISVSQAGLELTNETADTVNL